MPAHVNVGGLIKAVPHVAASGLPVCHHRPGHRRVCRGSTLQSRERRSQREHHPVRSRPLLGDRKATARRVRREAPNPEQPQEAKPEAIRGRALGLARC